MLGDLFHALRRGPDQLRYFRHTYSPLSPWREEIRQVVETAGSEGSRYGVSGDVDRRNAYQVARMVVASRCGEHVVDLLPDAYLEYSPPSAAGFHTGKRQYGHPDERRKKFRRHPQTLAFLFCPAALARAGLGGSVPGGVGPVGAGEKLDADAVAARLSEASDGKVSPSDAREYAATLVAFAAGRPKEEESGESSKAA